jgi:AraC-like DNA-binding protein
MDYIFDKEKLGKALYDFYSSTGIATALYDAFGKSVAGSVHSPYCALIRKCGEGVRLCSQSNLTHIKEVFKDREIVRYTCHAGLMEMIFPVVYEDILIAYIQIGQFRDEAGKYSSAENLPKISKEYGIDEDKLRALYEKLPLVSEERLHSICHILDILVKSFWQDGLITCNRSMLSVKIERYIEERLTAKISLGELCAEFFLSKNALYRLFAEEFNSTVNDFITKKRLTLAEELLAHSPELNVTEISAKAGFPDYNYFIRVFKKQLGKTPLQYRKRYLNN